MEYQRSGFTIKPNHSNALPRYILSLAVERQRMQVDARGRTFEHVFKCAAITSGRLVVDKIQGLRTESFDSTAKLWEYIYSFTKLNFTTWLIGTDVLYQLILCRMPAEFQSSKMTIDAPRSKRIREENDESDQATSGLCVLESPPTVIGCRVGQSQGRLVIVDTLNWFPERVSAARSAKGFIPSAENAEVNTNDRDGQRADHASYFNHSLFVTLIKWVKENQMGMFRYTSSAQSMGAYRHRFMPNAIYVHDNKQVQKLERSAYFGGRSEVFKHGNIDTKLYQLDVNSLFPSVMQYGFFPYKLERFEHRESYLDMLPAIDWSASVAEVELCTQVPNYPVRTDAAIIYPTGIFRTSLCGQELYRAFKSGCIRRVRSWSEYKLAVLFEKWVSELWDMRQKYRKEGNLQYELFTKRIMNSLYGKFAQLTPVWVNVDDDWSMLPFRIESRKDMTTGLWRTMRTVGWQCQEMKKRVERQGSFYAISAFVTAVARKRMNWIRMVAGSGNVYYQGVDSLIVNQAGCDRLAEAREIEPGVLGKMRIEYQSDCGYINGVSDYSLGDKYVVAGRAKFATVLDNGEVLQHKLYVHQHLFKNGPIDTVCEHAEQWIKTAKYNKGDVQPDGWVLPFSLGSVDTSSNVGSLPDVAAVLDNTSANGTKLETLPLGNLSDASSTTIRDSSSVSPNTD